MSKLKIKIVVFSTLLLVGLTAGFFLSGLVDLALSGDFKTATQLAPTTIIKSIATNERHRMLFLCIELFIISGVSVLSLMNKRETFESDTLRVTETIQTPIAIGQGQHGSARWLKGKEQRKSFLFYRFDKEDDSVKPLITTGLLDIKNVKSYGDKQKETPTKIEVKNDTDKNYTGIVPKSETVDSKS